MQSSPICHIKTMAPRAPCKDPSFRTSVLAMFNMLYSSTNQQPLEKKSLCNQSSHYENYRRFLL